MAHKLTPDERLTRLWARIDRTSPDGCWIWTGGTVGGHGKYGVVMWDGKQQPASRILFTLERGIIPKGRYITHTCSNTLCVNPAHLALKLRRDIAPFTRCANEANGRHKLTDQQVAAIRKRYAAGDVTQQALADEYGIHYSAVSYIVRGLRRPT